MLFRYGLLTHFVHSYEWGNRPDCYPGGRNIGTDLINAVPGDILCTGTGTKPQNSHVSIYLGNNLVVECSSGKGGVAIGKAPSRIRQIVHFDCVSGYAEAQTTTPALEHQYKNVIKKATLSKDGSITPTCTVCGAKGMATVIRRIKKISLTATSYTYMGEIMKPAVVVRDSAGTVISEEYYSVAYSNSKSKSVGSYKVTVSFKGNYSGKKKLTYKIKPAENPLTVDPVLKTYSQAELKERAAFTINAAKAKGKVTYSLSSAAKKAGIKVRSSGKVIIPKNCKSGVFKITVKAAGNKKYKAVKKTVTVMIQ